MRETHGCFAYLVGKARDERTFAEDEHGHEEDDRRVTEEAEGYFRGDNFGHAQSDGHQHGRDGHGDNFSKEKNGGNAQDAQRDIRFGGILGQFDGHFIIGTKRSVRAGNQQYCGSDGDDEKKVIELGVPTYAKNMSEEAPPPVTGPR